VKFCVHVYHHYDDKGLSYLIRQQEKIMSKIDELNTKIEELAQGVTDLGVAIDALIASDEANFQALKDALAANDPAAIDAAIAKLEASRAALATAKDKVVAADAADNLP
jgi:prefoldin subunit 5